MSAEEKNKIDQQKRSILQGSLAALPLLAIAGGSQADDKSISPAQRNVYVKHQFPEKTVNLGEITMNYATAGSEKNPPLLLIPGQTESWWGYEKLMNLLKDDFHIFAVDLRGQGRSSWTPGRYTLDNMGNDLVKFMATVIGKPVIACGNSSGGLLACWLAAYAMPGQVRAVLCEDPPLWASTTAPKYGHSLRQATGPLFEMYSKYLGDQWSIGDVEAMREAALQDPRPLVQRAIGSSSEMRQGVKEYDPEWARAFHEGTVSQSSPHEKMLAAVKVPLLLTHHSRRIDEKTGRLMGAYSDYQAEKAQEILKTTGVKFTYKSLPDAVHPMHNADPKRYAKVFIEWAKQL